MLKLKYNNLNTIFFFFFNFRKAELEAAMRKKIEFVRKALHIVEQLLEENISEEFLRECVCIDKLLLLYYVVVLFSG